MNYSSLVECEVEAVNYYSVEAVFDDFREVAMEIGISSFKLAVLTEVSTPVLEVMQVVGHEPDSKHEDLHIVGLATVVLRYLVNSIMNAILHHYHFDRYYLYFAAPPPIFGNEISVLIYP